MAEAADGNTVEGGLVWLYESRGGGTDTFIDLMSARGACEAAEGVLRVFRGVQRWVSGGGGGGVYLGGEAAGGPQQSSCGQWHSFVNLQTEMWVCGNNYNNYRR